MMKKLIMCVVLGSVTLGGMPAFAQFKISANSGKNLANLERLISRATAPQDEMVAGPIIKELPSSVVPGGKVGIMWKVVPHRFTPVAQCYKGHLDVLLKQQKGYPRYGVAGVQAAKEWIYSYSIVYMDQTKLARDLHHFYKGEVETYIDSAGRQVKLYPLPVDGILYKTKEDSTPFVLNSDEYFVVYDIEQQTGQIVENKPEVYNSFKSNMYAEIWEAMGRKTVVNNLEELCYSILKAYVMKVSLAKQRAGGCLQTIKDFVKQTGPFHWHLIHNKYRLLKYLQPLPKVRKINSGIVAYIIELPVEGLTWVAPSGAHHVYNPTDHVMLFFETGAVNIFSRADVENPELFTPVK